VEAQSRGHRWPKPQRGKTLGEDRLCGQRVTPPRGERIHRVRASSEPRGSCPFGGAVENGTEDWLGREALPATGGGKPL
jgi:hypothetical protein